MANRDDITLWIVEALRSSGGSGKIVDIAKYIWEHKSEEIKADKGNLLYTWQYEMRWAAQNLRHSGALLPAKRSKRGIWELKEKR